MRYEKTETGGICTVPCHFQAKYDGEKPVPNPMAAISTKDVRTGDREALAHGRLRSQR
jgi:hypothetical protein